MYRQLRINSNVIWPCLFLESWFKILIVIDRPKMTDYLFLINFFLDNFLCAQMLYNTIYFSSVKFEKKKNWNSRETHQRNTDKLRYLCYYLIFWEFTSVIYLLPHLIEFIYFSIYLCLFLDISCMIWKCSFRLDL